MEGNSTLRKELVGNATKLQVVNCLKGLGIEPHPDVINVLFENKGNVLSGRMTCQELEELAKNKEFVALAKEHAKADKNGKGIQDSLEKLRSFVSSNPSE